ncbi:MAG: four helix bundle protein [Ignavibacteria bacterium]|nr:four helix bundle protein [Ignavibacteria bacterium]
MFEISRSSLVEVDTQLEICLVLNYVSKQSIISINETLNILFAKLSNFFRNNNQPSTILIQFYN